MTENQLILVASLSCIALAFSILLYVIVRDRLEARRSIQNETKKRLAVEQRFSVILDADAEAKRIVDLANQQAVMREDEAASKVDYATAEARRIVDLASQQAAAREEQAMSQLASLTTQANLATANLSELQRSYAEKKIAECFARS